MQFDGLGGVAEGVAVCDVTITVDLDSGAGDCILVDRERHEAPALGRILQNSAGIGCFIAGIGMDGVEIVVAAIARDDERKT